MKLEPFVRVDETPFAASKDDILTARGKPIRTCRNDVGLNELDYGTVAYRFQDSGRLEEVTMQAPTVNLGKVTVPFSALHSFIQTACAAAFHEKSDCAGHERFTMQPMNRDHAAALPPEIAQLISREDMSELPIRRYAGSVHLLATPADFERAMQDICQESVVGFDIETRPAFRRGESYLPSLVQLATADAVYLMQVQLQDYSAMMREIFSSETITKAGVSVADDLRNLKKLFEFQESAVVDLGKVAKRHGLKQTGVRNLAGIFLGSRIPKGAKTTNWAARHLTPQQINYAATDAWACRELYLRFKQLNFV